MSIFDALFKIDSEVINGSENITGNNNQVSKQYNYVQSKKFVCSYKKEDFDKYDNNDYLLIVPYNKHQVDFPVIAKFFYVNKEGDLEEILNTFSVKKDRSVVIKGNFDCFLDNEILLIIM